MALKYPHSIQIALSLCRLYSRIGNNKFIYKFRLKLFRMIICFSTGLPVQFHSLIMSIESSSQDQVQEDQNASVTEKPGSIKKYLFLGSFLHPEETLLHAGSVIIWLCSYQYRMSLHGDPLSRDFHADSASSEFFFNFIYHQLTVLC